MKYDVTDFETQVVERSRVVPVVVDFWAQWCSPCRVLGPVLEKLSEENDGRWDLAKVDTDMMPEIAMQYGVRSIPAVKLFIDGTVVSEFVGAQPEHAIRKWLDAYIPPAESKETEQAEKLLSQGK
ncbi:MAG: thioredoxin, partial [Bacteroidota bacterium]|nr:thioredoxin [Bacteroidota bacterium]